MALVPDYSITNLIQKQRFYDLYEGFRESDKQLVVIKIFKVLRSSPAELAQFKLEYQAVQKLDLEGIVKIYKVENIPDGLALVMERFAGIPLLNIIPHLQGNLVAFLELAIQLADTLGKLHQANIIHNDLRPHNIFVVPETNQLKVSNFGIDHTLTKEINELYDDYVLKNILPYVSPERTGRTNHIPDYRSDLYSLGVTFYHLLHGTAPFNSDNPLALFHMQIAKPAKPLHEMHPWVPQMIADIVSKLLAKNPEDRYQNALGLKDDLLQCWNRLQQGGVIADFALGKTDFSDKLIFPQKLYAREKELETLRSVWERVLAGGKEVFLVSGVSGIGKSSLIKEFSASEQRPGYFIAGKCELQDIEKPYRAMMDAFRDLVRQLLMEPKDSVDAWRQKISAAIGINGRVITDIIPEFEIIIGEQPELPALGPEEAKNRFDFEFVKFIQVFARQEHPLVIILDDLQWVDAASLQLIETLILNAETQALLVLCACRDPEESPASPLERTWEALSRRGFGPLRVLLAPLDGDAVNRLIAETLKLAPAKARSLSDAVYQKTSGNPLFVKQVLKSFHRNKLLHYDPHFGWTWDLKSISRTPMTDDVVAFIAEKIFRLPPESQELVKFAACVGRGFDLELLSALQGNDLERTSAALALALEENLIFALDSSRYAFTHDRIEEAVYALLSGTEKKERHLKIGRLLCAQAPQDDNLFVVVDHLNLSADLINTPEDRDWLARLNLQAGRKAKAATAFSSAADYFSAGIKMLPAEAWETTYDLSYALYLERAECEYLCGRFEAAEGLFQILSQQVKTTEDLVQIYNTRIPLYVMQSRHREAIALGLSGLKLLGVNLSQAPSTAELAAEWLKTEVRLLTRKTESMFRLPKMTRRDKLTVMDLLMSIAQPASLVNENLTGLLLLKMMNLTLSYGVNQKSAMVFAGYGLFLASARGAIKRGYDFGQLALKFAEPTPNLSVRSQTHHLVGALINPWREPIKQCLTYQTQAYHDCLKTGALTYASYAASGIVFHKILLNIGLDELAKEIQDYDVQLSKVRDSHLVFDSIKRFIQDLKGGMSTAEVGFDEKEHVLKLQEFGAGIVAFVYYLYKIKSLYIFGKYSQAEEYARIASRMLKKGMGGIGVPEFYFFYSLVLAARYSEAGLPQQEKYLARIKAHQKMMRRWAANCPENFSHKYLLVEAELARIANKPYAAMELYDRALNSARVQNFILDTALASELAAQYYLARGAEANARYSLKEAQTLYLQWGAVAKADDLGDVYRRLLAVGPELAVSPPQAAVSADIRSALKLDASSRLDFDSVLKASQNLSQEISINNLFRVLIRIMIESAGAQKGLLFLDENGNLFLEAQGAVGEEVTLRHSQPLASCREVSQAIVNFVARTREIVELNDAVNEGLFKNDFYVLNRRPQSILCLPLVHQNKLLGVLYLENALTAKVFTPERVETLKLLSAQAAISLSNARLYQEINRINSDLENEVSRHKRTETALRESERLYRLLAENTSDVIWTRGRDLKSTYISSSIQQLTGYSVEEAKQVSFEKMLAPESYQMAMQAIQEELLGDESSQANKPVSRTEEMELICKDGSRKWVETKVTFLRDLNGRISGYLGVTRDIADRKRMEEERLKASKLESVGILAGGIAHDFNNILTGILGNVSLVKMYTKPEHETIKLLSAAENACLRAKDLTQQLLTFSMGGALIKEAVSIAEIIKDTAALSLRGSSVKCEFILPDDLWPVNVDIGQISRVIANIVINAEQAMPKGGRLTIAAENLAIEKDSASLKPGRYVKIQFADQGIGIPEEHLDKIFDPYFTTKQKGSGLGLAMSFSIVKKHGGRITVESRLGSGSTFTVYLPALNQELLSVKENPESIPKGEGRVLVMDDEEMIKNVVAEILNGLGYEADFAADGEEAIRKYKEALDANRPFQTVILDLTIPGGMGGKETIAKLREINPQVKAIVASGYSNDPVMADYKAYGFEEIISKPYGVKDLSQKLSRLLNR